MINLFSKTNKKNLKSLVLLSISFFLVITLVTSLFIIPKINQSFEGQHESDIQIELKLELELFNRYIDGQKTILQDLANLPKVTNTAMLSSADDIGFIDLFDSFLINSKKAKLVLQDIAGDIIFKTTNDFKSSYTANEPWIEEILSGEKSYILKLLEQIDNQMIFQLTVPIKYRGNIEGLLSAEINGPLAKVFVNKSHDQVAFKLIQDKVIIKTNTNNINLKRERSTHLENHNITFAYITDDTKILKTQSDIKNMILVTLFGGLLISFILLFIVSYNSEEKTSSIKKSKLSYIMPIIICIIGIAASIAAHMLFDNIQSQRNKDEWFVKARENIELIKQNIALNLSSFDALNAFYNASTHVDRKEFYIFTKPILKRNKNVQALEWVPKIPDKERQQYVQQAREEGVKNFSIKQRNKVGEIVIADKRDTYFPVYFTEPMLTNEKAIGFDIASNTKRLIALREARDSGKKVATPPIILAHEETKQTGVLVFNPIYQSNISLPNIQLRQENLKGFTLMVLGLSDMINHAIHKDLENIGVIITDNTDKDNPEVIFNSIQAEENLDSVGLDPAMLDHKLLYTEIVDLAGRQWKVNIFPLDDITKVERSLIAWIILFCGVSFVIFIAFVLSQQIRRRQIVEDLVKQRTAELEDSEQRFNLAIEATRDGIWDWFNMEEDKEYWSPQWKALLGYEEDEIEASASTFSSLLHPDDISRAIQAINDHLEKGIPFDIEYRLKTKQGKYKWFQARAVISVDSETGIKRMTGSISDIQSRKEAEAMLVSSNAELKRSNEDLDEFAYIASHDLKAPLRGIDQLASWITEDLAEGRTEEIDDNLALMRGRVQRMESLLTDLLAYARVGRREDKLGLVNVNLLVQDLFYWCSPPPNFNLHVKNELPIFNTLLAPFEQVLRNFLSNSIKHHDREDGNVTLSCRLLEQENFYEFSIQDDGPGIEKQYHELIFKMFKSLKSRDEVEGSGVGLALIKKIVNSNGGEVRIVSKLGKGTTFYFTWPRSIGTQDINKN